MNWHYNEKSIFGPLVTLESKDQDCCVYAYHMKDGISRMVLFQLFPGLYILFNDIRATSLMQEVDLYHHISSLEYCLSGSYEVELIDHRTYFLSEGDALFHHFGERVIASHLSTKRYRGVTIMLDLSEDLSELDRYLNNFDLSAISLKSLFVQGGKEGLVKPSYDLKKLFVDLYLTQTADKIRYYRLKIAEIFILMLERKKQPCIVQTFQLSLLEHIVEHMQRDLSTSLSIQQLAKEHGISLTALNHYFKDNYQLTPYQYLKQLRLEAASKMLKSSACPITEVASNVGFLNPSKFAIAFKNKYALSPSEYRKKYFRS